MVGVTRSKVILFLDVCIYLFVYLEYISDATS